MINLFQWQGALGAASAHTRTPQWVRILPLPLLLLALVASSPAQGALSPKPGPKAIVLTTVTAANGATTIIGTNTVGIVYGIETCVFYAQATPASTSTSIIYFDFLPSRDGVTFADNATGNLDPFLTIPLTFNAAAAVEVRAEIPVLGVEKFRVQVRNSSGVNATLIKLFRFDYKR